KILREMFLPLLLGGQRYLGVAVSRQIHQTQLVVPQSKKINQLSTTGGFTGARQFAVMGQPIDRTGFSRIRTAGKCHLSTGFRRALVDARGTGEESGFAKQIGVGHGVTRWVISRDRVYIMPAQIDPGELARRAPRTHSNKIYSNQIEKSC